jgi:protocatechuate 3,4-dioxygenase beta subunit
MEQRHPTRRRFILTAGTLAAGFEWAAATATSAQERAPTPACGEGAKATPRQGEGPFYKPRSPERADLREPGSKGRPIELAGTVLTRRCRPVAGALIELWHADETGDYDNTGFRNRGHLYTGADGTFRFRTIVPAAYTGRTRHYHVKVRATGARLLTTQLYFPDERENLRDGQFRRELLMRVATAGDGLSARFDFVLDLP